jgi:hypothetical protein
MTSTRALRPRAYILPLQEAWKRRNLRSGHVVMHDLRLSKLGECEQQKEGVIRLSDAACRDRHLPITTVYFNTSHLAS